MNENQSPASSSHKKILRDIANLVLFIVMVITGAFLINAFFFQSFTVYGPSMQRTLETNDRLVVNKIPLSWQRLRGERYTPSRGQVIVFKGPLGGSDGEHLVKRVIGLPGERVVVRDGRITVFSSSRPNGFDPDVDRATTTGPINGAIETKVPAGQLFVVGDNRAGSNSLDSRNGLGTVPLELVEGPVYARVYPFTEFRFF